ncbi:putative aliphatic sulfonates ABC transporter permease [Escherichia coli]|nr:putative aliphatic sulfonates ABC transporter permease [Escherichia coli]
MATPVKKWLLRVAPWFLPVGIVAVWQLASSVGWLSTRILPSPEGVVTAFLDALRQRRTVAASGDQLLAGADWLFNWRIAGVDFGTD